MIPSTQWSAGKFFVEELRKRYYEDVAHEVRAAALKCGADFLGTSDKLSTHGFKGLANDRICSTRQCSCDPWMHIV